MPCVMNLGTISQHDHLQHNYDIGLEDVQDPNTPYEVPTE